MDKTQCTDTGLQALAKGSISFLLNIFGCHNGSLTKGYPERITKEGFKEFTLVMQKCSKQITCHYNNSSCTIITITYMLPP